jgi:class I fructose-bisphosphate aldolase
MAGLEKITRNGRALFLAYDQGMEHGPTDFDDENIDPEKILALADSGYFTGVILQKGIAEKYYAEGDFKVPLIAKLNGKTNLSQVGDPYSPQVCSVVEALSYKAAAVGYTVYVGSEYEWLMTAQFGRIEQEAEEASIPVIGWMYPRGKSIAKENDPRVIAYAARVGLELGADIVKVRYTGDARSFSWVVKAAGKTKVVMMGGAKREEEEFLRMVKDALRAGAIGVAAGRNVWQNPNPLEMSKRIAEIVYG